MQVWFFNEAGRRWEQEPSALSGHTDWVRDVAWAPNLGLPLNTIASASQARALSRQLAYMATCKEEGCGERACSLRLARICTCFINSKLYIIVYLTN